MLWLWLVGCGAPEAPPRPSVVLLTLDTTRADRLGSYGYAGAHTPHLDRLATEGVRFERAYTTVPLTTPAHASMLSGLYPPSHGIRSNGDARLPAEVHTLAEVFQESGWRTGASVAAFVTTRIWDLDQGFDAYHDDVRTPGADRWRNERPADQVVDDAVAWLQQGEGPFLLWVHVYDAHDPFEPPPDFAALVDGRPYDGELAFIDHHVGRLREAVEAAAGDAGAAWLVVGDHGESLDGSHGEAGHGVFLFDDTARVPLIVRPPQPLPGGLVESEVVSIVDVWPTALALAGLSGAPTDGVDLSPALEGALGERAPVYAESETARLRFGWHPEVAVIDEDVKLLDTPSPHLFDVAHDPDERTNLASEPSRQDRVAALREVSAGVRSRTPVGQAAAPVGVDAQLEALGYLTTEAASTDARVDAKDRVGTLQLLTRASALATQPSTRTRAEALFRELLDHEPDLGEARLSLVHLLEAEGRTDEAVAELEDAVTRTPTSTTLRLNLGRLELARGDPQRARDQADAVLRAVPGDRDARALQVRALASTHPQEALAVAQEASRQAPDDPLWALLEGQVLLQLTRTDEAVSRLQAAVDAPVPPPGAHRTLAGVRSAGGDAATARRLLASEIGLYPDDALAHRRLGDLYMAAGDWAAAASAYAEAATRAPTTPDHRRAWAQATLNTGQITRAAELLAPLLPSTDPQVLTLHANVLALSGEPARAEQVFQQARRALERLR